MAISDQNAESGQLVAQVLEPIRLEGNFTAGQTAKARALTPQLKDVTLKSVIAVARATDTVTTFTLDVQDDGTSMLTAVMDLDVVAGTAVSGSIDSSKEDVAQASDVTIDIAFTGTSFDDLDILLVWEAQTTLHTS